MSLKNLKFKSVSAIIGLGLITGFGIPFLKNSPWRGVASVSNEKQFPPLKLNLWGHSPRGKMNQSMEIRIESLNGIPDFDEQEMRLVAHVTLNRSVDQELGYRWVLPVGASIISGEVEDSWAGIQSGQTATTEISIAGVSKEGLAKTVTLEVFAVSTEAGQSVKYANSGSFTTDPRSLESESEELALKKKEEVGKIKE